MKTDWYQKRRMQYYEDLDGLEIISAVARHGTIKRTMVAYCVS
jgi:hypothetical protein